MRLSSSILLSAITLLFAGCGTITYERARFDGNRVSNPTLGRGVYYQLPEAYSVLNPHSPVPTKQENVRFENFLRRITALNDELKDQAFREVLLFRAENRYLRISHVSINLPSTYKAMHPARRTLLMPKIAAMFYRYYDVPDTDFNYTYEQISGRTIIVYKPFKIGATTAGSGWQGIGFSVMGDVTDQM